MVKLLTNFRMPIGRLYPILDKFLIFDPLFAVPSICSTHLLKFYFLIFDFFERFSFKMHNIFCLMLGLTSFEVLINCIILYRYVFFCYVLTIINLIQNDK
jgi:hypothetical protein